ncbi:DJ-1/PfpI family protein [Nocardia sp. NPDC051990]|uniref:DJ-1/PfpI family protein n=1 Tax=Nocardia sp. NPDC051990 TaxID=3155285 RepID=UPI00343EFA4E
MPAPRTIVFVAYEGMQLVELAGPMDVFGFVNAITETTLYRLVTASPQGRSIKTDGGLTVAVEHSLHDLAASADEIDTLMVVGGWVSGPVSAEVVRELPALARKSRRVTSVCSGALLLAAAGLLRLPSHHPLGYNRATGPHLPSRRRRARPHLRPRSQPLDLRGRRGRDRPGPGPGRGRSRPRNGPADRPRLRRLHPLLRRPNPSGRPVGFSGFSQLNPN